MSDHRGMEPLSITSPDISQEYPSASSEAATWHPTGSQSQVLNRLHQLADVFVKVGASQLAGFRPACRLPLVIGSSGAGKTGLINEFAKQRDLPLLQIDAGSWLAAGSIAKPSTLRIFRDFIRANSSRKETGKNEADGRATHGILYLDECCKLLPRGESLNQSSWHLSVFAEATALLSADGRLAGHEWSAQDIANLRENYLLIGGAAFQSALADVREAQSKGGLGFGGKKSEACHEVEIRKHLPEELLSRFSQILVLESPTKQDFQEAIERVHSNLGVKRTRPMKELVDEAFSAQGGMRWVEKYLCHLAIEHPYCVRQRPSAKQEQGAAQPRPTVDLMACDMPRCLALTNETAASLRFKLGRIYSRLHQWVDQGTQFEQPLGLFGNPDLGESLVNALRGSQVITQLRDDETEELAALSHWRTLAWQVGYESATILARLELTEVWMEAWSLTCSLIDYRLALRRSVERGMSS